MAIAGRGDYVAGRFVAADPSDGEIISQDPGDFDARLSGPTGSLAYLKEGCDRFSFIPHPSQQPACPVVMTIPGGGFPIGVLTFGFLAEKPFDFRERTLRVFKVAIVFLRRR